MNSKGILIGAIVVVALLLAGWWLLYQMPASPAQNNGQVNNNGQATGTVTLTVTDAAADMGAISAVDMSVDRVYLHSNAQGWVLVSQTPQTFKLLDLKENNQLQLLAKADVAADTYDQIWLHVTEVKVTQNGQVKTAVMPTNDVKMAGVVKVNSGATSTANIDVLADQSLFVTAEKSFVFAPVIKLESRSNATATVDGNNMVIISGGNVDTSTTAGMDVSGELKTNFKIDAEADININL